MKKKELLQSNQAELKQKLFRQLKMCGYRPIRQDGFLYAAGFVPVLLVAHLDTVHKERPTHIWSSLDGDVWMADEGIGGDDRCGVYAILNLIRRHRVHVLFCEDEECGGIGAEKFLSAGIRPDVDFIIEFDRRGEGEAVFYQCDNPEFTDFICGFGFREAWGSFSDISVLAPALGVAAVNVSCGFHRAHTKAERIVWSELNASIDKIDRLLMSELKHYPYMERKHAMIDVLFGCDSTLLHWWEMPESDGDWRFLMPFDGFVRDDMGNEFEVFAVDQDVMIDKSGLVYEVCEDGITYLPLPECTAFDSQTGMAVRYVPEHALCCWTEEASCI